MLVIISDLHLTDGTSGTTISPGAFQIFAERLRELAIGASWRTSGEYRPIERLDLLLLGDVLDVIRSARWSLSDEIRPWSDPDNREYQQVVGQITADILASNEESFAILRRLAVEDGLAVPSGDRRGRPVASEPQPVSVHIHYMVGNHDWFYHLPGAVGDSLRRAVVHRLGLINRPEMPFPHDPAECPALLEAQRRHRVFARHGDIYDPFNFEGDRDASSLGDAIVIELLNRFGTAVEAEMGDDLPAATLRGLRELDNVRPLLLVPVWIDGLLERTCAFPSMQRQVKLIWDRLVDRFLELQFVRRRDTWCPVDLIDGLDWALHFSRRIPIGWASKIVTWMNQIQGQPDASYRHHALAEPDFRNRRAKHIVYGHTHHVESVPLDASHAEGYVLNQVYFNSGTWRRVFRQTAFAPGEHEFIPADEMTYLAFFHGDERGGRPYETWSGTLGTGNPPTSHLRIDPGRTGHATRQPVQTPNLHGLAPHITAPMAQRPIVPTRRE